MAASSPSIALPRPSISKPANLNSHGTAAWLPLVSVLIGIICLLYLAQTSDLTTTGYNIQQLQVEESHWKLRNEQVTLDLASARSLAVVEAEATGRLEMVRPEELIYLEARETGQSERVVMSSRGQRQETLALAGNVGPAADGPLTPVTNAISSLLGPRGR
jgi:hypothetical protein